MTADGHGISRKKMARKWHTTVLFISASQVSSKWIQAAAHKGR